MKIVVKVWPQHFEMLTPCKPKLNCSAAPEINLFKERISQQRRVWLTFYEKLLQ